MKPEQELMLLENMLRIMSNQNHAAKQLRNSSIGNIHQTEVRIEVTRRRIDELRHDRKRVEGNYESIS